MMRQTARFMFAGMEGVKLVSETTKGRVLPHCSCCLTKRSRLPISRKRLAPNAWTVGPQRFSVSRCRYSCRALPLPQEVRATWVRS